MASDFDFVGGGQQVPNTSLKGLPGSRSTRESDANKENSGGVATSGGVRRDPDSAAVVVDGAKFRAAPTTKQAQNQWGGEGNSRLSPANVDRTVLPALDLNRLSDIAAPYAAPINKSPGLAPNVHEFYKGLPMSNDGTPLTSAQMDQALAHLRSLPKEGTMRKGVQSDTKAFMAGALNNQGAPGMTREPAPNLLMDLQHPPEDEDEV